jgi:hypothetical protein
MPESESWQPIADTLGFSSEEEMLKHLYIMQEFSLSQLRNILGYSTWAIRRRLIINGIPLRGKGGPNNRLGRRRLKELSDEELTQSSVVKTAEKHQVHISTVYAEIRLREREKKNEFLLNYASQSFPTVRSEE